MANMHRGTHGSAVAFEGQPDTITTQLRLLPSSPQILILPALQSYLPLQGLDGEFEPRTYVRHVHDALATRNEIARTFLAGSTPTNKRLVFMNGGTASAVALCIRAIMEHETRGDRTHAVAVFNHLIKDGYGSLGKEASKWENTTHAAKKTTRSRLDSDLQDPITRAMRAADALDRETANLQPSNDLDLTLGGRSRSSSLPLYGYSDEFGDVSQFFAFGFDDDNDSEAPSTETMERNHDPLITPTFAATNYNRSTARSSFFGTTNVFSNPPSPCCVGETHRGGPSEYRASPVDGTAFSPMSDSFSIRTTDNVVYGEASLMDMRLSVRKSSLSRVKSLDRSYPTSPKFRDLCISPSFPDADLDAFGGGRRRSSTLISEEQEPMKPRFDHVDRPRTIILTSKRPTVNLAPVPEDRKKKRQPEPRSYADRGTDASVMPTPELPFQPVFSCTEDLVVYFKDRSPNYLLHSVIAAYKEGRYPMLSHSTTTSETDGTSASQPATPTSQSPHEQGIRATVLTEPAVIASPGAEEYDPYAYMQPTWSPSKQTQNVPTVTVLRPPTPAQTPPPYAFDREDKFHDFDIASDQTAVVIQNSLRSVLNVHFPPASQGYHQFHFSLLPELEGLWQPVFRGAAANSLEGAPKVDLILAIGSQRGVQPEYTASIMGQLEAYGSKPSGLGRSGRLDFRYLLANAMQAFTAQPLASQTSDNPFTNPYLLATLIVPHLETYLALHSGIKYLLLEYPPSHLATVLALQKVIGADLVKIAQIVDPSSKDRLPFTHLPRGSISNISDATFGTFGNRSSSRMSSSPDVISRANFLLTSKANKAEITQFISAVWDIYLDPSESTNVEATFEATEKPAKVRKAKPAPLRNILSPFPKVGPLSPLSPFVMDRSPSLQPPTLTPRPASADGTIKPSKSINSKPSRSKSHKHTPKHSDATSSMTFDPADDSDYDQEERRLMPMFMHKPKLGKGNSRKALKFLGLA